MCTCSNSVWWVGLDYEWTESCCQRILNCSLPLKSTLELFNEFGHTNHITVTYWISILQACTVQIHTWLKKKMSGKKVWTMNDATLWNSEKTRQACYSVPFIYIQGIFYSWWDFEGYVSVLLFLCHYDAHVRCLRIKAGSSTSQKTIGLYSLCLVYAVYPTTFLQLGVSPLHLLTITRTWRLHFYRPLPSCLVPPF